MKSFFFYIYKVLGVSVIHTLHLQPNTYNYKVTRAVQVRKCQIIYIHFFLSHLTLSYNIRSDIIITVTLIFCLFLYDAITSILLPLILARLSGYLSKRNFSLINIQENGVWMHDQEILLNILSFIYCIIIFFFLSKIIHSHPHSTFNSNVY